MANETLYKKEHFTTNKDVQDVFRYVYPDSYGVITTKMMEIENALVKKKNLDQEWLKLYGYFKNYSVDKETFTKAQKFAPDITANLLGIATLNHNGYIREAALNELRANLSQEVLPYLLLRLNDWVLKIRELAKNILEEKLPIFKLETYIYYLKIIEWLSLAGRADLKPLQYKIHKQIYSSTNTENLLQVIPTLDYKRRLFLYKIIAENKSTSFIIDIAIKDKAPEIRQWVSKQLPKDDKWEKRITTLLNDKAIRVRYSALKIIPNDKYQQYIFLFKKSLFDSAKYIREYVRFVCRKVGIDNFKQLYRDKIIDTPTLGVISGLAETGEKQDIYILEKHLDHRGNRVRAAVLAGLHRLDPYYKTERYIASLQDGNAKIRQLCVKLLQSDHPELTDAVRKILLSGIHPAQIAALKVLVSYSGLEALRDIMLALNQDNKELQILAWAKFQIWYKKYSVRPWFSFSEETYQETKNLYKQVSKKLFKNATAEVKNNLYAINYMLGIIHDKK